MYYKIIKIIVLLKKWLKRTHLQPKTILFIVAIIYSITSIVNNIILVKSVNVFTELVKISDAKTMLIHKQEVLTKQQEDLSQSKINIQNQFNQQAIILNKTLIEFNKLSKQQSELLRENVRYRNEYLECMKYNFFYEEMLNTALKDSLNVSDEVARAIHMKIYFKYKDFVKTEFE